jgi:acyl-CoA hydrolase
VAVHTALQLDLDGQLNVESVAGSAVAGIGGQPDYAYAAGRSADGLSVVAVPTARGRHLTLVEHLEAPASTASHDIDVIVTELGVADLRGLDRADRRRAIAALWER